jgi:hypothetical protein
MDTMELHVLNVCFFQWIFFLKKQWNFIYLILDYGCSSGGYLSCINNGTCNDNHECECLHGYNGTTCQTCTGFFLNLI